MNEEQMNIKLDSLILTLEDKENKLLNLNKINLLIGDNTNLQYDASVIDNVELSKEHLVGIYGELNKLGYNLEDDTLYHMSTESYDSISAEDLDGERKSLIARVDRYIRNVIGDITSIGDDLDSIMKLMKTVKTDKLTKLLNDLNSGVYKESKDKITNPAINSDLAFYFVNGHTDIELNSLKELCSTASDLLLKDKLFDVMTKYAYDNLIVGTDVEDEIPTHQASVKHLDKITLPEVRDWLNKNTKFGIYNRYIGNKFRILSVYQDEDGADVRFDTYNIPKNYYFGKTLSPLTLEECKQLVKEGIDLANDSATMAAVGRVNAFDTFWKSVRSKIGTMVSTHLFNMFAVKRWFRQINMGNVYSTGTYTVLIGLKKSHIDMLDMIHNIVIASTKGK